MITGRDYCPRPADLVAASGGGRSLVETGEGELCGGADTGRGLPIAEPWFISRSGVICRMRRVLGMRRRAPRPHPTGGRAALLALVALAAPGAMAPSDVHAAGASHDYEGAYASSSPEGYPPAPAVTAPGQSVTFAFSVSPAGILAPGIIPPPLAGSIRAQRVTLVGGVDVSSGTPAIGEDEVLQRTADGSGGEPPVTLAQLSGDRPLPGTAEQYAVAFTPASCGYYVLWTGDAPGTGRADPTTTLNAGVLRVTGCRAVAGSGTTTLAAPRPRAPGTTGTGAGTAPGATHPPATAPGASGRVPAQARSTAAAPGAGWFRFDPAAFPEPPPATTGTVSASGRPPGIQGSAMTVVVILDVVAAGLATAWMLRPRRSRSR